jgi:hypothetical protein
MAHLWVDRKGAWDEQYTRKVVESWAMLLKV